VFLSIDDAIFINWLTPEDKLKQQPLLRKILEPLSEILHDGRAAGCPRPIVYFDNATLHRSAATEITFNLANSDILPSHPIAWISVRVSSFYSAI
jgi:hypothetical protein